MQSIRVCPKNGGHTAPHGAGIGPDASEFETVARDPAATARAIVKATKIPT